MCQFANNNNISQVIKRIRECCGLKPFGLTHFASAKIKRTWRQILNIIVQTLKPDRNGEPIKRGTDGILNYDQSKMLFPVMCHLMYIYTRIFK